MATFSSQYKPIPLFSKDFYLEYYVVELTTTTSLSTLPVNNLYVCNSASPITVTLPTAVGKNGCVLFFKNINTGNITIDGFSTQTIDGQLTQILYRYSSFELVAYNGNWFIK